MCQFKTLSISLLLIALQAVAHDSSLTRNLVVYPIEVEQWVTTKTAKTNIEVNATLDKQQDTTIQQKIMQDLAKIAPAAWHVTRFNRSQSSSGLNTVQATVEARLSDTMLADLNSKVTKISKPGMKYKVVGIQFTPSFDEKQAARDSLRDKVYQRTKVELAKLNQLYPKQTFMLHQINFLSNTFMPRAMPTLYANSVGSIGGAPAPDVTQMVSMPVGNLMQMKATIAFINVVPAPK